MTHDPASENERRTRRERINPRLQACGCHIVSFSPDTPLSAYNHHAIEEYPTPNGPADYALVVDGQLLGVVEAKKVSLGPQTASTEYDAMARFEERQGTLQNLATEAGKPGHGRARKAAKRNTKARKNAVNPEQRVM